MKIKEIMTGEVKLAHPNDSLRDTAQKMKKMDIGMVPVVEEDNIVGVLTDRDMVTRVIAENQNADETTVRDAMTTDVTTIYNDQDITDASEMMKTKQIRRLVVKNRENDKLAGIVSLGDIAEAIDDPKLGGEVLEKVSEPSEPKQQKME